MKTKKLGKHKKMLKRTSWVLKSNPVVAMGLALPFAVVPTVSLRAGVVMSLLVGTATLWMALISSLTRNWAKPMVKLPLLVITSMLCIILVSKYMNLPQSVTDALGIYIPLASVNSLALEAAARSGQKKLPAAVWTGLKLSLSFALTACSVSAVREILAYKTIWGVSFALYPIKITGLTLPCFGFIVLGFGAAFFKGLDRWIAKTLYQSENRTTALKEVGSDA